MTEIPYAATILLIRRAPGGPEVYLMRRNRKMAFMGGAFVFPGGKLSPEDFSVVVGDDRPLDPTPGRAPEPGLWAALRAAAARETFEEAGVYWGPRPPPAEERGRVHADPARFGALLEAHPLDLSGLQYCAHWITPSRERRRFDTHFFLGELPEGQEPSPDGSESVQAVWMTPAAALAAHQDQQLYLPPPTYRLLELAAGHDSVEALRASFAAQRVVPVLPKLVERDGVALAILPWDPSFTDTEGEGDPTPPGSDREAQLPSAMPVFWPAPPSP